MAQRSIVISLTKADHQLPVRSIRLNVPESSISPPLPSPTPESLENLIDDQTYEDDAYEQENNDFLENSEE